MTTTPLTMLRSLPASLALAAGWLTLLTAGLPQPGRTGSNDLRYPSDGIVCDRGSRICYDRRGISLPMTRREYGKRAERNLTRQVSGRPAARTVRLSSGDVCDLRRQICWEDGWQRTNVNERLSRQLFGNNSSWGQPSAREQGFCELNQRGRRILSGNCDLQQRTGASGTAFRVDFGRGRRYSFHDRRGRLVMVDGARTWPVAYNRNGSGAEFRWSDLQLLAYRNRPVQPRYGTGASGGVLQELVNNLFR